MTEGKYHLCIVAHPDDEAIFLGGLILNNTSLPWKVICLTDGNADGSGVARKHDFEEACRDLGVVEFEMWGHPDVYGVRLPIDEIQKSFEKVEVPQAVFTHGPLGEYGHPHHQDTSLIVHKHFCGKCPVYSVAYNCYPDIIVEIDEETYARKVEILTKNYGTEFNRFAHLIPASFCEGYKEHKLSEVEALYHFLTKEAELDITLIPNFASLAEHIKLQCSSDSKRIF